LEVPVEFIGDIERAFGSVIYPNRVLIAIVSVILLAAIGIRARRRRWDLAARRHPRRALATALVAAAVLGPLGWYLGSPLFLSTSIDEAPPVAVGDPPATDDSAPPPTGASQTAVPTRPGASTPAAPIERTGSFAGADEFHFGRGTARVIETAPGSHTVRLEDFAVRNGPDLFVYLSPDAGGYAEGAIELGRLKADQGNQNYQVPTGTDMTNVASVVIWCKQFAVVFAIAPLS
jgi:hypothetical protein